MVYSLHVWGGRSLFVRSLRCSNNDYMSWRNFDVTSQEFCYKLSFYPFSVNRSCRSVLIRWTPLSRYFQGLVRCLVKYHHRCYSQLNFSSWSLCRWGFFCWWTWQYDLQCWLDELSDGFPFLVCCYFFSNIGFSVNPACTIYGETT